MEVKIKLLHEDAVKPTYAHSGDACMDITAIDDGTYISYDIVEYRTGLSFDIPDGYEIVVRPRSSISKTMLMLVNSPATIDSNFKGELKLRYKAFANGLPLYKKGDRIAQMKIEEVIPIEWVDTEELSVSERGEGSFGSTGK